MNDKGNSLNSSKKYNQSNEAKMLNYPVDYMEYALSLAELARGYTSPNPAVGAVIVKDHVVVGLGHTQPPGAAHAEIMALKQAGERARGATLYVTLEPCCHKGRTPPCTDAIINAGIKKVHAAIVDPNPLVSGKGIEKLQNAGISVVLDEHKDRAREINEGYIKHITTGRPFVIVKFAMSMDGKIATKTGDSKWITGEEARNHVHRLRHIVDAIMVGANTVIADNPRLSARGCINKGGLSKNQPLRVIVDGRGRTPVDSQIFKEPGKTLMIVSKTLNSAKKEEFINAGAEIEEFQSKKNIIDLSQLLKILGARGITTVLVEGGGTLLGDLFDHDLVDKVMVCIAPIIIGGEGAISPISGTGISTVSEALRLHDVKITPRGDDIFVDGYIKDN